MIVLNIGNTLLYLAGSATRFTGRSNKEIYSVMKLGASLLGNPGMAESTVKRG